MDLCKQSAFMNLTWSETPRSVWSIAGHPATPTVRALHWIDAIVPTIFFLIIRHTWALLHRILWKPIPPENHSSPTNCGGGRGATVLQAELHSETETETQTERVSVSQRNKDNFWWGPWTRPSSVSSEKYLLNMETNFCCDSTNSLLERQTVSSSSPSSDTRPTQFHSNHSPVCPPLRYHTQCNSPCQGLQRKNPCCTSLFQNDKKRSDL